MAEMIDIAGFRINWGEWNQLNQQLKADLLFMLQFCGGKMTNSNMKSSVVARPDAQISVSTAEKGIDDRYWGPP